MKSFLRKIPHFKGKFRLVRLLFRSYLTSQFNITITGTYNITYKLPNLKEIIAFELFADGIYEPDFIDYFVKHIPENGVLLDLGANIGAICIPIAKRRPDIKIIAVEASPHVYSYLSYNITVNNCNNILCYNKALALADHENIKFYSPDDLFGKGSMSPVFTKNYEYVETITLSALVRQNKLSKIDFIKIDVEGFEKIVFVGGDEILRKDDAPQIIFEFVDWAENAVEGCRAGDAQDYLRSLGYSLFDVTNPKKLRSLEQNITSGFAMILAKKNGSS